MGDSMSPCKPSVGAASAANGSRGRGPHGGTDCIARSPARSPARDWDQFHTPKNLAMALTGEAGELIAHFQWLTAAQSEPGNVSAETRAAIEAEMADVLIYLVRLADRLEVDLLAAAAEKVEVNEGRYPVARVRGSAAKWRAHGEE